MEKNEVEKLFDDLAEATGEAIALVASAIARQTDAEIVAMQSLNALEEECEIQKPANH